MNIKQLKLHNFWSHRDSTINFDKDFYMIIGGVLGGNKSNGSGKSSLARAICYVLYGTQSDEITNDGAIHNDEKEMFVELTFELNSKDIVIKRAIKRGSSPVLTVTKDGDKLKPGLKAGQAMVNELLGANFNIFKNTSYFKQGDLNSFSALSPKEAKSVIMDILQVTYYNKYEDLAKEMLAKVTKADNELTYKIANLEEHISTIKEDSKDCLYTPADLINLNNECLEIQLDQAMNSFLVNSKNSVLGKLSLIQQEKHREYSLLSGELTNRNNQISKLAELSNCLDCPTCSQSIDAESVNSIMALIDKEVADLQVKFKVATSELETISDKMSEVNGIDLYYTDRHSRNLELKQQIGQVSAELKRVIQDTGKIAELEKGIMVEQSSQTRNHQLQETYSKLQKAFSKKGIQAHIVDSIIPEIQATTNDILEGLDTPIRVSIDSQKELKSGAMGETLDINILTPFGERPYTNYSGGEKTLIDFSIRIALSIILTRRSDCQIQTLILDEVWGQLDSVNRSIASKCLKYIADKFNFKKILIISHQEELQDAFPNVIRVNFDGDKSVVTQN